ncbi:ImmA/IrrE family metallo-endopeptidase [Bacillus infantis]|uniref:ImmA/IrrE family metallo-endopeptidase n=1 Tax=Bacillus infantis TaxID=324767 RepID=UPI003CF12E9F
MNYPTSLLEDWIKDFYYDIGIFHPHQLDLTEIAYRLGMVVSFENMSSRIYKEKVIIDERLPTQEQWEDFGHELCHALRHFGNQMIMSEEFLQLQEFQARYFSLHFCIPTFMLQNLKFPFTRGQAIHLIAETFKVTYLFAKRRLEMYESKISSTFFYEELYKAYKE